MDTAESTIRFCCHGRGCALLDVAWEMQMHRTKVMHMMLVKHGYAHCCDWPALLLHHSLSLSPLLVLLRAVNASATRHSVIDVDVDVTA